MISDPAERRLHPAGIAIAAIRHASGTWFIAVAIIAGAGPTIGLPLVIGGVAVLAALAYVEWRVTRYAIVDGGLRYRSGVLARREVDIPASRISALDTTRGILQRIFGVVALQVQTPGGGGKAELTLHAVSLAEAERLRRELGHRAADRAPAAAPGTPAQAGETADDGAPPGAPHRPAFIAAGALPDEEMETVFTLSARDLLLAGLTSPSGAVVGAIFAAMYGPLRDVFGESAQRSVESGVADAAAGASTAFLIILGVLVLLGIAVVSVLSTALQFANFKVTRDEQRLRVRRGLVTERTGTVQLDRIHALRIVETPIRQALGYVSVEAEVAGWGRENDAVKAIAPFVRREALPDLLPRLVLVSPGRLLRSSPLLPGPRGGMWSARLGFQRSSQSPSSPHRLDGGESPVRSFCSRADAVWASGGLAVPARCSMIGASSCAREGSPSRPWSRSSTDFSSAGRSRRPSSVGRGSRRSASTSPPGAPCPWRSSTPLMCRGCSRSSSRVWRASAPPPIRLRRCGTRSCCAA